MTWKLITKHDVKNLSQGDKLRVNGNCEVEFDRLGWSHDATLYCTVYDLPDGASYFSLSDHDKWTLELWQEPVTQTFPDFDFKLDCGDSPEVRQWLKDNGCEWCAQHNNSTLFTNFYGGNALESDIVVIDKEVYLDVMSNPPLVKPTFTVTNYTCEEHEQKALHQAKIEELESTVKDALDQIEKLKEEL